jgi:hypothetical protein
MLVWAFSISSKRRTEKGFLCTICMALGAREKYA